MSERKVINKYYPPDFDPSKIPRRKLGAAVQITVRLMAPYSMRCLTCGEYIYKGKKFNARKETVQGEEYYGIKIFRFYIKCTQCSAEITFKTDPKNTDYLAEHGAARNFEPWRASDEQKEEDKLTREEEEENNPMAALENKSVDSKREIEILDALQELRTRNARIERVNKRDGSGEMGVDDRDGSAVVLTVGKGKDVEEEARKREMEADEEEVRKVFGRAFVSGVPDIELGGGGPSSSSDDASSSSDSEASTSSAPAPPSTASIKRKLDSREPTPAELLSASSRSIIAPSGGTAGKMGPPIKKAKKKGNDLAAKLGIKLKK